MALLTGNFKSKLQAESISADKQGVYLFGGLDDKKNPTNDLYHIKPCNKENSGLFDPKKGSYYEDIEPRVYFEIKKIEAEGIAPPARCQHTTEFIGKYLVIFGGSNQSCYTQYKNTSMNDIHMFDISCKKWETIALYGYVSPSIYFIDSYESLEPLLYCIQKPDGDIWRKELGQIQPRKQTPFYQR